MINPKWRRYWVAYRRYVRQRALDPFGGITFTIIQTPLYYYLLRSLGSETFLEELRLGAVGLASLGASYLTYLVWCLLRGLFAAKSEDLKVGSWAGIQEGTYVYHEPLRVLTTVVTAGDSEQSIPFSVPDAPPNSFINYLIEAESAAHRIDYASLGPNASAFANANTTGKYTGGILLYKGKTELRVRLKPETVPITFRVYVRSWEPR